MPPPLSGFIFRSKPLQRAALIAGAAGGHQDEGLPPGLIRLAPLDTADPHAVEHLLDAAFGTDRHGRTAYRLRAGTRPIPALSFAAFDEAGTLVGTLQSWPVELVGEDGSSVPLVLVGPVAVRPDRQRDRIGRQLMDRMLAAADGGAADRLMLIGDPEYYERFFNFTAERTGGWVVPGPVERHRLLARVRRNDILLPDQGTLRPSTALRKAPA